MADPVDLRTRVERLRAVAMEHLEGDAIDGFAKLICDRCGHTVELDSAEQLDDALREYESRWDRWPEIGDLCPNCNRLEKQARYVLASAEEFAERARKGEKLVALFAAPGSASLTVNGLPMYETTTATNDFLSTVFGEPE